jgi:predicted RNA-binding Zn-ribbon protein involved in translation (DUF1610 family)
MADSVEKKGASCTHCGARFTVPTSAEGKSAKCPKCGKSFTISFQQPAPSRVASPIPATPISSPAPSPATPAANRSLRRISVPLWALVTAPAVLSLVVGYFAGREHLKYQMRSAFTNAGRAFAEGLKDSLPPGLQDSIDREEKEPDPPPRASLGEAYDAGGFSVQVVGATIRHPDVKRLSGDSSPSEDPLLVVDMQFTNKDDRKLFTFRDERGLGGSVFRLKDDVGNIVRPVTFGFDNKVVGALDNFAELKPEASLKHLQVFDVPLPKTKSLVLNVDLYCFEGEGEVEIDIPIEAVKKDSE